MLQLAFAAALTLLQGAPSTPSAPASIEGIVIEAGSGKPLAGSTVALMPPELTSQRLATVTAASDGTFVLSNVQPGEYRLVANRTRYTPGEYAQRGTSGRGLPFVLAPGQ
jgi:hypothetical protein